METIYTAYTRVVNGVNFFFVKRYSIFTEYENSPKILEDLGMHTDFFHACRIAKVYDEQIIQNLFNDLPILHKNPPLVTTSGVRSMTHTLLKNTSHALSKLRLAGTN